MTNGVALESRLSFGETANIVSTAFVRMRAHVEAIEASPHPLDRLDGVADVAVVGRRSSIMTAWAVQVYLFDMGETCGVEMVALGEAGLARARRGPRSTVSLPMSLRKMTFLVAELRGRDPRAQLIG